MTTASDDAMLRETATQSRFKTYSHHQHDFFILVPISCYFQNLKDGVLRSKTVS